MTSFYTETKPIAKKEYNCDASVWLYNDSHCVERMSEQQLEVYNKAAAKSFKIKIGTRYIKQRGMVHGEWQTYRARIDMHDLARALDVMEVE